ncbi:hypothetical protein NE865_03935 [Phthorimaea operculella]|nr:hypothetical protein NE865_03935 [Phthorimaea operculella]
MASDPDDFDVNIENLKTTVKQSFARVYAALKARELKTLRQLDALRKHCENNQDLKRHCVQNIHINYEDYVSPNDDHMYSYKTIQDLSLMGDNKELEAIEEAALKEITKTDDCVCFVAIRSEDVSKQFREIETKKPVEPSCDSVEAPVVVTEVIEDDKNENSENSEEDCHSEKKIEPTDDWLNSIKSQTETEPTQVTDVMEHSTITCS